MPKGPLGPDELGSREDADKMRKESHDPAEWTPGLRLRIRRTRKTQRDGHKSEGSKYCSYVRSPAPSHMHPLSNPFVPLQIKGEVNILLKKSSCVFIIASVIIALVCIQYIYVYFCMNMYMRMPLLVMY